MAGEKEPRRKKRRHRKLNERAAALLTRHGQELGREDLSDGRTSRTSRLVVPAPTPDAPHRLLGFIGTVVRNGDGTLASGTEIRSYEASGGPGTDPSDFVTLRGRPAENNGYMEVTERAHDFGIIERRLRRATRARTA